MDGYGRLTSKRVANKTQERAYGSQVPKVANHSTCNQTHFYQVGRLPRALYQSEKYLIKTLTV
jgi:hypothetical protein